ncbi:MAG: hypothetical protein AAFX50_15460, partial [Acidobacteriota bacterium]
MSRPAPHGASPAPSDADFVRRRYRVPAALEDDFAGWLVVSCGALGCQVQVDLAREDRADVDGLRLDFGAPPSDGPVELDAWFDAGAPAPDVDPARWPGVEVLGSDGVAERDWLEEYRAQSRPFVI